MEFRFWWRIISPYARLVILRELGLQIRLRYIATRRWIFLTRKPIVIGA